LELDAAGISGVLPEHHADAATSLCDLLNGLDDKALKTVVKLIEEGANVSANDA